jgi:hypothetical protein
MFEVEDRIYRYYGQVHYCLTVTGKHSQPSKVFEGEARHYKCCAYWGKHSTRLKIRGGERQSAVMCLSRASSFRILKSVYSGKPVYLKRTSEVDFVTQKLA